MLIENDAGRAIFSKKKIWQYISMYFLILSRNVAFSTLWRDQVATSGYFKLQNRRTTYALFFENTIMRLRIKNYIELYP